MQKKWPLIVLGVGVGVAILICIISLSLYGKIYFFNGYGITKYAWIISIGCVICGLIGCFKATKKILEEKRFGKIMIWIGIACFVLPLVALFVLPSFDMHVNDVIGFLSMLLGVLLVIFGGIRMGLEQEEQNRKSDEQLKAQLSDPEWRKNNPESVALYEDLFERQRLAEEKRKEEEQKKLEFAQKRKKLLAQGIVTCPRCGSRAITSIRSTRIDITAEGYSAAKELVGGLEVLNVCQACAHRFYPGV